MTEDLERIVADLRRHRDALKKLNDDVTETSKERESLYRAVERIRSRTDPAETEPPPAPEPIEEPAL